MTLMDRRAFIARGIAATGGGALSAVALERLAVRAALADKGHHGHSSYGEPQPVARPARDRGARAARGLLLRDVRPHRLADVRRSSDAAGARRHGRLPRPGGTVRLIRNHEDRNVVGGAACRTTRTPTTRPRAAGRARSTTTRTAATLVRDFISLSGTHVNCAGGYGLHRKSWLTGEETVFGPEFNVADRKFDQRHGYVFEVPLHRRPGESDGQPLKAMGRFMHEALATDERSGVVYRDRGPRHGPRRGLLPLPAARPPQPRQGRPAADPRHQGQAGSTTRARGSAAAGRCR